jgi:spermidine synthase
VGIRLYILISGAALLAAQATWSRLASAQVGGSFTAAMLTLSAAMAGLGLGAARPWRSRRAIVAATALALAATPLVLLQVGRLEGWPVLRLALTALLLAAAHAPFGMILPRIAGRHASTLYALGALGGAAGALAYAELLAPRWGFDEIGVGLSIATLIVGVPLMRTAAAVDEPATGDATRSTLLLAAALGVLGLLTEALWLQLFGYYWEAGTPTFALVTAASVAGISAGAAFGRRLPPGLAAVALAAAALLSPLALNAYTTVERFGLALLLVGIPAACVGGLFASLLPRAPAALLAANAAGSAAGPLLLLAVAPWSAWPARMIVGVAVAYGLLGRGRRWIAPLMLAALYIVPALPPGTSTYDDFNATVVPFARCGVESTVTVTRNTSSGVEILWIDRGFQGDTSPLGRRIPAALGRIPGELLGRPAHRALAIGLGTGLTAASIPADTLEVAELSAGVIEANRTILAEGNGQLLDRVVVHHGDGRTRLADEPGRFDLIVTDMMFPTVAGAGNVNSREYFALARRRLDDDGVFVHWLPCFLLAPEDLSSVVAAFMEAFPDGSAWIGHLDPRRLILGLAGGRVPSTGDRFALGPAELRALAGDARPLRDADPRLEIRSNRAGSDGAFGRENLLRILPLLQSAEWQRYAEAGLAAMDGVDAFPLYRRVGNEDGAFAAQELLYERQLAQAQLRRAARNPLYSGANLQLGEELAAAGRIDEAIAECEAAARKSPRSADASIRLARLAAASGRRDRAREALDAALRLRPDVPPLYEELSRRLRP